MVYSTNYEYIFLLEFRKYIFVPSNYGIGRRYTFIVPIATEKRMLKYPEARTLFLVNVSSEKSAKGLSHGKAYRSH